MGYGSHHLAHILFIIIFLLISFYCTSIFIARFSAEKGYYINYNANGHENQYPRKALVFGKFLGVLDNHRQPRKNNEFPPSPSPSPSPSRAASHAHHYHSLPRAYAAARKRLDHTTAVIIASTVGVIACLLCAAVGVFLKFKKQRIRGRRRRSVLVFRSEAGGGRNSKGTLSVKKVISSASSSSDPPPDLFYLDSLESALQQEYQYRFQPNENNNKLINDEMSSSSSSTSQHIVVVDDYDETFPKETISISSDDDDESFHSFSDSQSSRPRLSNASASEIIIISQGDQVKETQLQPSHDVSSPPKKININQGVIPPPPPPPPPPPCPPRTNSPANYSLKAPPPPPPDQPINQQVPLGKDGSPLRKLKPLHWDKVRAAPNRSTVWDKLRSSSFEFDEEMIESLFGYNLQNSTNNDEAKSKTPSPGKHVLDRKRLQNIIILSKALSVTAEQVCLALIRGDGLSLQDLEALSKMVPTKEEESKLANYKGETFELGSAERLVIAMLKIPFGFSRIEAMLYRETFEDEVLHLQKSFAMLEEACMELRSSRLFLKLLEAVLKTGNRMNVGTIRGGAKAFKLDTLLKLSDVKGTDGKTTLLHFVVQEIIRSEGLRVSESIMGKIHQISKSGNVEDKEEKYRIMGLDLVSGLSTELCNAKKTATIDLDVLARSVANLSDGMHKLQDLVQKDMVMVEKRGSFVTSIRSFLNHAEIKLKELQEDENRVLSHVREITEYFHGDVSKDESNPLRIFVIVRDFLSMLDNVCKELRSSKATRSPNPLAPFH